MTIDYEKLAETLSTQDNRATSSPLFRVEQERRIYGIEIEYCDAWAWQWADDPEYRCDGNDGLRDACREDGLPIPSDDDLRHCDEWEGYERIGYIVQWEVVTVHFTAAAARRYIDENRHNLTEPRIFVSSQNRCHEWNAVVADLKAGRLTRSGGSS